MWVSRAHVVALLAADAQRVVGEPVGELGYGCGHAQESANDNPRGPYSGPRHLALYAKAFQHKFQGSRGVVRFVRLYRYKRTNRTPPPECSGLFAEHFRTVRTT